MFVAVIFLRRKYLRTYKRISMSEQGAQLGFAKANGNRSLDVPLGLKCTYADVAERLKSSPLYTYVYYGR